MRALAEMEHSGLVPLLVQDRAEDLARMHALFSRVEGGSELLRAGMVRPARLHLWSVKTGTVKGTMCQRAAARMPCMSTEFAEWPCAPVGAGAIEKLRSALRTEAG